MAHDPGAALLALQFGDSAFPSGGFAFSWGLEGLAADGLIETADDVAEIVEEQLVHRWAVMDRILLREAHQASSLAATMTADHAAEAATLAAPMRAGSRRAGRALLGISARLGHQRAILYREATTRDPRLGHLAVVQGLVFQTAGLTLAMSETLSGWAVVSSLASAAVRLGLFGHVAAQVLMTRQRATLERLLACEPPPGVVLSSFTPLIDIALSRNTGRAPRMFAT